MEVPSPSLHFCSFFNYLFFHGKVTGILIVSLILQWVGVSKITSGIRTLVFGQRGQAAPVPPVPVVGAQVAGANPA